MGEKKKVSAFELASECHAVTAEISVKDVMDIRSDWSRAEAIDFMNKHGGQIGEAMAQRGAEVLVSLLLGGNRGN